jgi:hypothetical protein
LCGNRQGLPPAQHGATRFGLRSLQREKKPFLGSDRRRRYVPTMRDAEGDGHSWGHDAVCLSVLLERPSPGESGTRPNTCLLRRSKDRHAATG